jgi:HPt (histidine-containing phosphotransfer) domain-containing protein
VSTGVPPALRDKFSGRLPSRIRHVVEAAEHALSGADSGGSGWDAARNAAHQLAGTAGSFGFDEVSRRLRSLELAFDRKAPAAEIRECIDQVIASIT